MKLSIFAILDDKSGVFSQPLFYTHKGVALRSFGDEVANPESNLNRHASDYHLYQLGTFDDNSGKFISSELPEFVAHAVEFKPQAQATPVADTNENINLKKNQINPQDALQGLEH